MKLNCPEFLEELHHLFGTPPAQLPNGKPDFGFNCYAKAFVVMYLCRLRGMAVDVCLGKLLIMQKGIADKYCAVVDPHAWAGSPKHKIIDSSIADFQGHRFLPVLHDKAAPKDSWVVGTTLRQTFFQETLQNFRSLPSDSYMLYYLKKNRLFVFDDILAGGKATNSPPTQALTSRYGANNVLAKSIWHLHLFLEGNRTSLRSCAKQEAWDTLARLGTNAVEELRKTLPHPQA